MRLFLLALLATAHAADVLPLAGEWRFQLDPDKTGVDEKWFGRALDDTIPLPGTTDEARKGPGRDEAPVDRLARPWAWVGAAWYQRNVTIPDSWAGKRITLHLERTKNSRVWIDGHFVGLENTLSTPHIFDVSKAATPGKHTLTILIDNSKLPPVGPSHQVDERTQTNWNGILGTMELRATDPVWIHDAQAYPDAKTGTVKVRAALRNTTGSPAQGWLIVHARTRNGEVETYHAKTEIELKDLDADQRVEFTMTPDGPLPTWDEFHPELSELDLRLKTSNDAGSHEDRMVIRFGMRDFTADGSQLKVNGTPAFLRGRLDCANYPLTGYAPMDKAEWKRIYGILKQWGLNHVRFHSWCPPRAAFEAADEAGFYLQVELPNKRSAFNAADSKEAARHNIDFLEGEHMDEGISLYDYGKREGELILREFGNHPSFVMFTLGNELGRNDGMFELVRHFKLLDPRRLYAQGANNMHWNPSLPEGDEFWVTGKVGKDSKPIRGSFYLHDYRHGAVDTFPPGTLDDFGESIEGVPVPMIGHETGQYQVYPDFRDIDKFTGVLKGRNYETFRERLEKAGMLDQAGDFVKASGALAALCYREDIELALRTPGFGGFQLLDIMDFPGQSTALVGMLNVFMESKGVIDPAEWRQFCSGTVPLLRTEKLSWTKDETFTGKIQVAHFGAADLTAPTVRVTLRGLPAGEITKSFTPEMIRRGSLTEIGDLTIPLDLGGIDYPVPRDVLLEIAIDNTPYRNHYRLWIYPTKVDTEPPADVLVSRTLHDEKTRAHLADGGRVLLLPELDKLPHSVGGGFQTEFWSPMFATSARKRGLEEPPGTLGILCNPQHPALAGFPTSFHADWQWWHLLKHSRPIILDDTPRDYRPIVQAIDNFDRNHKLGLLLETKVGKGSALVCAIDLPAIQDQPEGRQFLHSLLRYVGSDHFNPGTQLNGELLKTLLPD